MTSTYDEIFSRFLLKITDYSFAFNSQEMTQELMAYQLRAAVSKSYLRRIFKTFEQDDTIRHITFELSQSSGSEIADKDYVLDLISTAMIVEWLEPKVYSTNNIAQMFGGKEQKWFSQAQHLTTLQNLLKESRNKVKRLIRDHGYIYNSYIGGSNDS